MSAPGRRWHNAIRVRAKPCVQSVLIIRTLPQRSSPSGLWTPLIREYNDCYRTPSLVNNVSNMKFSTHCLGLLIFYAYDSRTSKSIGNNTMKKMLLATALALLITGCAQQTFTVQNKPAAVAPKETIIISSFLELGRRKLSMQPKFVAAQKMLLKQKPSKHS